MIVAQDNPTVFDRVAAYYMFRDCEIELIFRQRDMTSRSWCPIISFGMNADTSIYSEVIYSVALIAWNSKSQKIEVGNHYQAVTSNYFTSATDPVKLDTWHRMRVIRKGTTYKVYLDGALVTDVSFPSSMLPTEYDNVVARGKQKLFFGAGFTGNYKQYIQNPNINILYVKMKNESDTVVLEFGKDPGGAPAVASPKLMGVMYTESFGSIQPRQGNKPKGVPVDLLHAVKNRSVATQKGIANYDSLGSSGKVKPRPGMVFDAFYKPVIRGSQRASAYILDMTGSGNKSEGSKEVVPPRAFPLESQWKKSNPTSFNN